MNELQFVAGTLGLKDTATLGDVSTAIQTLRGHQTENVALKARVTELEKAIKQDRQVSAAQLLDAAIEDGRIDATQREAYAELFDANHDAAAKALGALKATPKLHTVAGKAGGVQRGGDSAQLADGKYLGKTFAEYEREDPGTLAQLKADDFDTFNGLYKAQYGNDYQRYENK
jgi:hypothetical protein